MEGATTPGGGSSFRESDVEFLKTQAREWLEAMLGQKLDAQSSLADLLADGELLYKVSLEIKEDMNKSGKFDHFPTTPASPEVSRKNSMKYLPYSYVEAFLKVCKEVGLTNVDLFNPPDAVDKKDIRHVCVCLRRLSKKARMHQLPVPDFDNVKQTLTTHKPSHPTEQVHSLRDSLEQSVKTRSHTKLQEVSKETSSSIADLRREPFDFDNISLEPGSEPETFNNVHQKLDEAAEKRGPIVTEHYTVHVAEPGGEDLSLFETAGKKKEDSSNHGKASGYRVVTSETDTGKFNRKPATENRKDETVTQASSKTLKATSPPYENPKANLRGEAQTGQFISKPELPEGKKGAVGGKGEAQRFGWLAVLAGVAVVVGGIAAVVVRERRRPATSLYEVKPGDTLLGISRETGKSGWQEIAENNPNIGNPDLIYPGDRLKL